MTGKSPRQPLWRRTAHWVVSPTNTRDVMSLLGSVGVYSTGQAFAWRGLGSADFSLSSSLQRALPATAGEPEVRAAEEAMLAEARAWGLGVTPTGFVDDLQLLADLQHYGIGTRLLDFSANPMTALWFACQEPVGLPAGFSRSGVVLALNITGMPRFKTLSTTATYAAHASPLSHQLQEGLDAGEPFVVESLTPNDRIRAQEGFFVAGATPDPPAGADQTPFRAFTYPAGSGAPSKDLEALLLGSRGRGAPATMPYVAVIIRAQLKAKLLEYLQGSYNRAARVLFPDYQGFATHGSTVHPRS